MAYFFIHNTLPWIQYVKQMLEEKRIDLSNSFQKIKIVRKRLHALFDKELQENCPELARLFEYTLQRANKIYRLHFLDDQ